MAKVTYTLIQQFDALLPANTGIGGYPIYYLDARNTVLCADCATKSLVNPDELPDFVPVAFDVYWEGADMHCDTCNTAIQSAYGEQGFIVRVWKEEGQEE